MLVIAPLTTALAGCGFVGADPNRFERWAQDVAAIPVSYEEAGLRGPVQSARAVGLRGPVELGQRTPMRIEVVEPEVLWEARADGFRGAAQAAGHAVAEAVVHEAVVQAPQVAMRSYALLHAPSSSAPSPAAAPPRPPGAGLSGTPALADAAPRYEEIQRGGRTLVPLARLG